MWPLAGLVFFGSIAVPVLKLGGMAVLLVSTQLGSTRALRDRTALYRVIDAIGRWSNIDIFTIAVFLPLMQFGPLVAVDAGGGAPPFLLVIVLTMLASRLFDPRLLWDAAEPAL